MARKSVYLPAPSIDQATLRITDEEHRHLVVTRAEPGEVIEVFDGKGSVWDAVVVQVGKHKTIVRVQAAHVVVPPKTELILGLALVRPAAFELALEKVVEVGVTRIIPFAAARSNAVAGNRGERWQRIIVESAKQSKRFYLPQLDPAMKFPQILNLPSQSRILFAEHDGGSLKPALSGLPVLFLVGPEGGWTDDELVSARSAGFHTVSLGSGILRTETAAIVGASLIRYELEAI